MRRLFVRTLSLGIVLALASACAGDPEATIGTTSVDDVTGGEIIVSGDLTAGSPSDGGGDESTDAAASTGEESTDGTTAPPTTVTTTTTRATTPPTTRAPSTTSSANNSSGGASTATTEAPVIGDGPVLTVPVGIDDSGESPGVGTGLKPVFFALEATTKVACNIASPGTVSLRWEVIGVETVDIAVKTTGNIRSADQPPAGTIDLSLDCTNGSQYFVVAENPDGKTTRSVSVSAR